DGDDARRTRRRRGGKGRRRGEDEQSGGESDADADTETDARAQTQTQIQTHNETRRGHDSAGDDNDSDSDSDNDGESTSGRRRTRRRRRTGSSTEGEDPPGTVTRVRESRSDEATGIRGSTRLEAKKQRRREGREAGRRRTIVTEAEFLARRESVERVMVVRQRGERTQIAVLEDGVLVEHYVSRADAAQHGSMAGNVYLGRVQNVLPSMEAAFVDVGRGRNAVLYAGEVNWDAAGLERSKSRRIEHALSSGQGVLVQVTKDPIGHKGARLSSQISLPGRYLVYVPEGHMTGISRKLPDTERARLKKILRDVVPAEAGVIVRTAAEGASEAELRADVERLSGVWEIIQRKAKSANPPTLLHGEVDLTVRVIRDVFNEDFSRLVVSGDDACVTVEDYLTTVAPDLQPRLEKWTGEADVFSDYRVDEQLAKAMDRKVWLPSGGSLVIDRTEAMTVIDVNTGKFVGAGGNLEETVTKNNVEAAEEIVRQLRLRDTGGIIVIDFIDMVLEANRDLVIRRLLECLGRDRTKHQVAEVTSLGLVQMTRKRVGAGLIEVFSEPCEHCAGRGIIVQSTPVERQPEPVEDRRRGRRGRPAGTSVRGASSSNDTGSGGAGSSHASAAGEAPTPSIPSGPTPAQMAAAAYAALHPERRGSAEGVGGHGADGEGRPGEDASREAAATDTPGSQILQAAAVATDLIHVSPGASSTAERAPIDDAARHPSVPSEASPEREREDGVPASAGRPRRRRGRATAPAGPPRADRDGPADGAPETTPEQG
ncbi:MAG: Rne/Rng family ribonuclease, partial [Dermatophilaceae bacterium]